MTHLHVVILDDELLRRFRRIAYAKYGFQKGALSRAAEEALREWVGRHLADTHTKTGRKFPPGATGKRLKAILQRLDKMWDGKSGIVEIPLGLLRKIIQSEAGMDPRTINKYIKFLLEMYIIEIEHGTVWVDLDFLRKEVMQVEA